MNKSVSLEEILFSKENRQKTRALLRTVMPYTLISFTLNYVGQIKKNTDTQILFEQGVREIEKAFDGKIRFKQFNYFDTGFEGYFAVEEDAQKAKRIAADIEDSHTLGRLWDIDVFDSCNNQLTRSDLGLKKRKCLLCDADADYCYILRRHSQEELLEKIKDILKKFSGLPAGE
jgi:holo-ACP synthase